MVIKWKIQTRDIQSKQEIEYMLKDRDFYPLLKTQVEI